MPPRMVRLRSLSGMALAAALAGPATAIADPSSPGVIRLEVDATDLDHRVFGVHETLPVQPGPLTLQYPKWLPGTHGPSGDIASIAGLRVTAGGGPLAWQRDTLDPYRFRVDVPAGVQTIDVDFQRLTPTNKGAGRVVLTPVMLDLEWNEVVLYPAGTPASAIAVQPSVKLPAGWQYAGALRGGADANGWWRFGPVTLEALIDSPLAAGRNYRRVDLDAPSAARPVVLHLFADEPQQLEAADAQWAAHRRLVEQADRLFRSRHFDHYDFLLWLSETLGGIGLEHHESSENAVKTSYFKDWDKGIRARSLLPHEFTHSWNGKFRRPADLTTPDYNTPMQDTLLWVYEGQTQYWGRVLTARSGLATVEQSRLSLAYAAAWAEHRSGRAWRDLQDTTNQATFGERRSAQWPDWQRGSDYYDESALIWLDADTLIREKTGGQRSLDNFAADFFGVSDGERGPLTYRFEDMVQSLAAVLPYDWARFLRERLDTHEHAPLDGLARSGWKLTYSEKESEDAKAQNAEYKISDFGYSIGLRINTEGHKLTDVLWNGAAYRAGLAPGLTLVAVNGVSYKPERLAEAIGANRDGKHPIELLVQDGEQFRSVRIDYRDGLRYPALERLPGTSDLLGEIFAPR